MPGSRHGVSVLAALTEAMQSVKIASEFSVQPSGSDLSKKIVAVSSLQPEDGHLQYSTYSKSKTGALKERTEVHFYNDTRSAAKLELNGVRAGLCCLLDFTHQPESISFMQLTDLSYKSVFGNVI